MGSIQGCFDKTCKRGNTVIFLSILKTKKSQQSYRTILQDKDATLSSHNHLASTHLIQQKRPTEKIALYDFSVTTLKRCYSKTLLHTGDNVGHKMIKCWKNLSFPNLRECNNYYSPNVVRIQSQMEWELVAFDSCSQ